jgi:hypothetical protein
MPCTATDEKNKNGAAYLEIMLVDKHSAENERKSDHDCSYVEQSRLSQELRPPAVDGRIFAWQLHDQGTKLVNGKRYKNVMIINFQKPTTSVSSMVWWPEQGATKT